MKSLSRNRRGSYAIARTLRLEPLPARALLSGVTSHFSDGIVTVSGSPASDEIIIAPMVQRQEVHVFDKTECIDAWPQSEVREINVQASEGDDLIRIANPVTSPVKLAGGPGIDTLLIDNPNARRDGWRFDVEQGMTEAQFISLSTAGHGGHAGHGITLPSIALSPILTDHVHVREIPSVPNPGTIGDIEDTDPRQPGSYPVEGSNGSSTPSETSPDSSIGHENHEGHDPSTALAGVFSGVNHSGHGAATTSMDGQSHAGHGNIASSLSRSAHTDHDQHGASATPASHSGHGQHATSGNHGSHDGHSQHTTSVGQSCHSTHAMHKNSSEEENSQDAESSKDAPDEDKEQDTESAGDPSQDSDEQEGTPSEDSSHENQESGQTADDSTESDHSQQHARLDGEESGNANSAARHPTSHEAKAIDPQHDDSASGNAMTMTAPRFPQFFAAAGMTWFFRELGRERSSAQPKRLDPRKPRPCLERLDKHGAFGS